MSIIKHKVIAIKSNSQIPWMNEQNESENGTNTIEWISYK